MIIRGRGEGRNITRTTTENRDTIVMPVKTSGGFKDSFKVEKFILNVSVNDIAVCNIKFIILVVKNEKN